MFSKWPPNVGFLFLGPPCSRKSESEWFSDSGTQLWMTAKLVALLRTENKASDRNVHASCQTLSELSRPKSISSRVSIFRVITIATTKQILQGWIPSVSIACPILNIIYTGIFSSFIISYTHKSIVENTFELFHLYSLTFLV